MEVWVRAESRVVEAALAELVARLGMRVSVGGQPPDDADVALLVLNPTRDTIPEPPPVPTVAVTTVEDAWLRRIARHGYRGVVSPDGGIEELRAALWAAWRGESWLRDDASGVPIHGFGVAPGGPGPGEPAAGPEPTRREHEVLEFLAMGMTNRAIGERLGISERTVKTHISNLLSKYQRESRGELVAAYPGGGT